MGDIFCFLAACVSTKDCPIYFPWSLFHLYHIYLPCNSIFCEVLLNTLIIKDCHMSEILPTLFVNSYIPTQLELFIFMQIVCMHLLPFSEITSFS